MSELTVELEDEVISKLRVQAARKGISLEEEALSALRNAVRIDADGRENSPSQGESKPLEEAEIEDRFRRLKLLGRAPSERVDLKALSDRLSDPIG